METRLMILQQAGHNVIGTMSESEVIEACKTQGIDVAVVGQGISQGQKRRVLDIVRRHCPKARVLELYIPSIGRALHDADDWMEVPNQFPEHLGERVTGLAQRRQSESES
jgi:hypothetical protein